MAQGSRTNRFLFTGIMLLVLLFSAFGNVQPAYAAPSKEPIYYLSIPEDDALQAFRDNGGATAASPVRSVTSIAIASSGTIIYYDQWEDNFLAEIKTSGIVWGDSDLANGCPPSLNNVPNPCAVASDDYLDAGEVVVLDNLVTVIGAAGGPYSRNPAQIFYDGRDKFLATYPVAVGRALWPSGPGSLQAGGVEMFEYNRWGALYEFPFTESATFPTGLFEDVRYFVIAGPGGSTIDIDADHNGTPDAGFNDYVMAEGAKLVVNNPLAGGTLTVVGGSNVQVTLAYADTTDTYEMRWSALIPRDDWSNDYYSPVGTPAGATCTNVWVYNPNTTTPLTVNYTLGGGGTGTFSVPARGAAASTTTVALGQGIRLYTNNVADVFLPFSVTDCSASAGNEGQIYDWDTSLFPADQLSSEILVGWAPGCTDESARGTCLEADGAPANTKSRSVVWITPLANTTIYVDTNGSGITCPGGVGAEQTIAATALASYRIDDDPANVRDQFDTRAYNNNGGGNFDTNWTGNWTEVNDDGNNAAGSIWIPAATNSTLQLRDPGVVSAGDYIYRSMNLSGMGFARLSFNSVVAGFDGAADDRVSVQVYDSDTGLWTILPGGTFTANGTTYPVYDISGYVSADTRIRFNIDLELEAGDTWTIDNVNIDFSAGGGSLSGDFDMTGAYIRTCNNVKLAAAYGQNPTLSATGDNEALDLGTVITPYYVIIDVELDKLITPDDTPDLNSTVTFTLNVTNTSLNNATNIDVTDVVPDGYTYLAGTIAGGNSRNDANPSTTGLTWTINSLAPGASTALTYQATVLANDTGARLYNNYAEIQDHDQPDDDSTPGNGSTTEDDDDEQPVTPNAAISGTVTADTNNDNIGDTPLVGVTVELFADTDGDGDPDGVALQTLTTGAGGAYTFGGLTPGTYVVVQTNLAGYVDVTDGDSTADMAGSPADAANASPIDNWLPVNLASAEQDSGNDFVDEQLGSITGSVLADANNDNVGDAPLAGVTLTLYSDPNGDGNPADGAPVDLDSVTPGIQSTALSQVDGSYTFLNVPPGPYVVVESQPVGYLNVGESDTTADTPVAPVDAAPTTNNIPVNLAAGETDSGNTFVEELPGTVFGHLYLDTNGDGNQDPGEPDLAGVDVLITPSSGAPFTVTTDSNGDWTATVPPGSTAANVDETDPQFPAGATQTEGTDPTTVTAVAGGNTDAGNDGYYRPGSVSGHLYIDTNGDGNQDPGEPDLAGVDVLITPSTGVPFTVTTDANGDWTAQVPPGSTTADVDETDPQYPTGYIQTEGDDPTTVTAVEGLDTDAGIDGYYPNTTVYGHLYIDTNGDGNQDPGEPDLAGVNVLVTDASGTTYTVSTDANGDWIADVVPGSVTADVDETDPQYPTGYTQTEGTDPTIVTAILNTAVDAGIDGYHPNATVYGHLYLDLDGNGAQDLGEPDLANVDVVVTDSSGATYRVATDANGNWSASVVPGSVTADVDETDPQYPAGYTQTDGTDPTTVTAVLDADVDAGNDGYYLANPALNIVKEVSDDNATWVDTVTVDAGDTVYYRVRVQNTGNITLTNLVVDDGMADCTLARGTDAPGDNDGNFEVGETWVYTCQVTAVTGLHLNTATADSDQTGPDTDTAEYFASGPRIGVAKRVVGTPVEISPGVHRVTYEILVQNYGNVALSALQVTDDLSITFPLPTTFTVVSLSSVDFTENWPGYDGQGITGDIDLLTGVDTLLVGASGTITLVVDVIPTEVGPFDNTAIASGQPPAGNRVTDRSQDGIDPDPDSDGNPTNNNVPTPVSFGPILFDPPFGLKLVDGSGEPVLRWTMIWINNTNIVAVNAAVHDPIPVGTAYVASGASSGYPVPGGAPAGSTDIGVSCTDASAVTVTTNCYYEGPTGPYLRGRIIWEGTLGPDLGVTDPAVAVNDITITFSVTVATGITSVENTATIDSDLNGDGDVVDTGEQQVARAGATWQQQQAEQPQLPPTQPDTGFAPGRVTEIGSAPVSAYDASGNLRLVIPTLRVNIPIVGVPLQDKGWDVTWLWKQAGWLEGTAYPTFSGNSVLTAHVYDANGLPGPFVSLGSLKWGDRIIVKVNGLQYIYEVRTNEVVSPNNMNAFKHEEKAWLTLVTCRQYDEASNTYKQRVVVRAVLINVLPGAVISGK